MKRRLMVSPLGWHGGRGWNGLNQFRLQPQLADFRPHQRREPVQILRVHKLQFPRGHLFLQPLEVLHEAGELLLVGGEDLS